MASLHLQRYPCLSSNVTIVVVVVVLTSIVSEGAIQPTVCFAVAPVFALVGILPMNIVLPILTT
eukprot:scaffold16888_cov73-Skeletonema_marinoi.AAC.1